MWKRHSALLKKILKGVLGDAAPGCWAHIRTRLQHEMIINLINSSFEEAHFFGPMEHHLGIG